MLSNEEDTWEQIHRKIDLEYQEKLKSVYKETNKMLDKFKQDHDEYIIQRKQHYIQSRGIDTIGMEFKQEFESMLNRK